jgi:glycine cleavage system H protein
MPEFLEATVGKFIFRVATDRLYNKEGIWLLPEKDGHVRLGLADFAQQRNGDVAFAEVRPAGTVLKAGDELATIETIKVIVGVPSPLAGTIVATNPAMETSPEVINQDPYGDGWLAVVAAQDVEVTRAGLLAPEAYFAMMKSEAEEEARKP